MKMERIYVLVCDGGRGEVLSDEGRASRLSPVSDLAWINAASAEPGERATGYASVGARRYSVEEHGDPRAAIEEAFLAEMLDGLAARESAFDRLVIVAPPKALGIIRKRLPASLRAKLAGEIDADLTKADAGLIGRRVTEAMEARRKDG